MSNPFARALSSAFCCLSLIATPASAGPDTLPIFPFENGLGGLDDTARISLLKELGYDGIGSARPDNVAARLKQYDEAGLKIFSLYVGGELRAGHGENHTYDPAIAKAIAQLKGRGDDTTVELYVRGGSKNTDDQAVAFVREIADLAKASGLKVVLYPHTGFYVATLDDAVRIANLSERENVGVMFNLCHFLKVEPGADLRATLNNAGDLLWRASISGADVDGKDWPALIQPLGRGTYDVAAVLAHLRDLGYSAPIGVQCYNIKSPPADHLKQSIEAWRAQPIGER